MRTWRLIAGTWLTCLTMAAPAISATGPQAKIVIQDSPLAGFRYHQGSKVWDSMKPGDTLTLKREASNPHDPNAIRVEWNGSTIGYVPRTDNIHLARQMDRGSPVEGTLTAMRRAGNGRHVVSYEIHVRLQ